MQVTARALFQRIDRALRKDSKKLVVNRAAQCWSVIDLSRNAHDHDVFDLQVEAKRLGVLKPYEELAR
jgi:hypothetical protein